MKVVDALRDHCTYNPAAQRQRLLFSRILGKIPELRRLSLEGIRRLSYLKEIEEVVTPPAALIQQIFLGNDLPF